MIRKFENTIMLILSAVIAGGLFATLLQYQATHPETSGRILEYQRAAAMMP